MMKAISIINETIDYYSSDTSRRATAPDGGCRYYDADTGKRCAVGRYMLDPEDYWVGTAPVIELEEELPGSILLDDLLLPDVRGLPLEFWDDLQLLHDTDEYWNSSGLSAAGKRFARIMRARYHTT